ncbi:MAG: hypothetical protein HQK84_09980 [Nitrospinae bacterium]|nr:hypothetical protein [Nitrospinota bacterium]
MQKYKGAYGFMRSLGIKNNEKVVILTDSIALKEPINILSSVFKEHKAVVDIKEIIPDEFLDELPESFIDEIKAYDVVLFMAYQSWYHTKLRRDAKYVMKKRVAECYDPCVELLLDGAMTADFEEMDKVGNNIARKYKVGDTLHIASASGTDFSCKVQMVAVESGCYETSGSGGNLPAGEVSLGVVKGSGSGKIVFDVSFELVEPSELPVTLEVDGGCIVKATNKDNRSIMHLLTPETVKNIAEVGIGINDKALLGRTILEDEKKNGTAHVGIGSNIYFGGNIKGPHYDGVFQNPLFTLLP